MRRAPLVRFFAALAAGAACASAVGSDGGEGDADAAVGPYSAPAFGGNAAFLETFQADGHAFKRSNRESYAGQAWEVAEAEGIVGIPGDKVFSTTQDSQRYGVSAPLQVPFLKGEAQSLVVQYEVKLAARGHTCGGAYLKLLAADGMPKPEALEERTPYVVMFGPDKCGANNKVHFILRHRNPKSDEWTEHHLKDAPPAKADNSTHLYTLIVRPDNTFDVQIDSVSVKSGSLLEEMDPPVNPSKEIDDPNDKKPEDWVDEAKIPDVAAVKPVDWDESEPAEIVDEDAVKPAEWLDDEPDQVPDPAAVEPEGWDEDEDGTWEASLVSNPRCEAAPGCGAWTTPRIPNPKYKGKWVRPIIDNPDYVGEWKPAKIPNPHYFVDEEPHILPAIGGVAIEIWVYEHSPVQFDNILVTADEAAAAAFAAVTWGVKSEAESSVASRATREAARAAREDKFVNGGLLDKLNYYAFDFAEMMARNPIVALVTMLALMVGMFFMCNRSSKPSAAPRRAAARPAAPRPAAAAGGSHGHSHDGDDHGHSHGEAAMDAAPMADDTVQAPAPAPVAGAGEAVQAAREREEAAKEDRRAAQPAPKAPAPKAPAEAPAPVPAAKAPEAEAHSPVAAKSPAAEASVTTPAGSGEKPKVPKKKTKKTED